MSMIMLSYIVMHAKIGWARIADMGLAWDPRVDRARHAHSVHSRSEVIHVWKIGQASYNFRDGQSVRKEIQTAIKEVLWSQKAGNQK